MSSILSIFHQIDAQGKCGCGHEHPFLEKKGLLVFFVNLALVDDNKYVVLLESARGGKEAGSRLAVNDQFHVSFDPNQAFPVQQSGREILLAVAGQIFSGCH